VDALVARWYRDRLRAGGAAITGSGSAQTRLLRLCKSEDVKGFLRDEVQRLRSSPGDPDQEGLLASLLERLGEFSGASMRYRRAIKSAGKEADGSWHIGLERCLRTQRSAASRQALLDAAPVPSRLPVPMVKATELSSADFQAQFAGPGIPVVIRGFQLTQDTWSLDYVSERLGHRSLQLKSVVPDSAEWARLEAEALPVSVSKFVQDVQADAGGGRYLHDWSLPLGAPEMLEGFKVPEVFSDDLLRDNEEGTLYRDSWPSLFVSGPDAFSPLHVDTAGLNFWMALFSGRKRWILFGKDQAPLLGPQYVGTTLDPVFEAEPLKEGWDKNRDDFCRAVAFETVLEPGDVLFVPGNSPHTVENLEAAVAVSGNFVDRSNFDLAVRELDIIGRADGRAKELAAVLRARGKPSDELSTAPGGAMPWPAYKRGARRGPDKGVKRPVGGGGSEEDAEAPSSKRRG